tara:strand:- start:324 stop:632 length:309 start_codon:yes stop_codon:yes gene_type:complete
MPYDKDGKYYRKPVLNENFKSEKKKPLNKEPNKIKFKKKSVYIGLGTLIFFVGLIGLAQSLEQVQLNKKAKRICNSYTVFRMESDYNECLIRRGFKGKYQRL